MQNNYRDAALGAIDTSGYSDYEISRRSGIRTSSISRWRTGRTHPRKNSLRQLAAAIGTTVRFYSDGELDVAEFQQPKEGTRPSTARYEEVQTRTPHPVYTWTQILSDGGLSVAGRPQLEPVHKLAPVQEITDPTAFAVIVDIQKDRPIDPFIRFGDVFLVSPAATVRNGDHVLIKLNSGQVLVKQIRFLGDDLTLGDAGSSAEAKAKSLSVSFYHKIVYVRKR